MNPGILRQAYDYWFGPLSGPDHFPADKAEIWFKQSDETDAAIRGTFGPHLETVAATPWSLPDLARQQRLGLVIFLDQFPRNIFRESAEAFACDVRAREVATALVERNLAEHYLVERAFLFLPLEHSEALADQDRAVRLFEELAAAAPPENRFYAGAVDFARKHRDLILRFGRFPHRNVMLGRESTPEEDAFLKEYGRGY